MLHSITSGNLANMQYIGSIQVVLSAWDPNSSKHGRMRSFSTILFLQSVLRGWCSEEHLHQLLNWKRIGEKKENSGEDATSHEHPSQPSQLQSTGKPVALNSRAEVDQQNLEDVQKNDDQIDRQGVEKPVLDFRAQGLPRSQVKETEIGRVRESIGQIENHPKQGFTIRFEAKPTSTIPPAKNRRKWFAKWVTWTFELCETDPKVPCSYCLKCWHRELYIAIVFFAWFTRTECVEWIR